MRTASEEKYLEVIYRAASSEGYTRVTDIAQSLNVGVSSVTKMIRKLAEYHLVHFKRYREIKLTEQGVLEAKKLIVRQEVLSSFMGNIGVNKEDIKREVSMVEHYISENVLKKMELFNQAQVRKQEQGDSSMSARCAFKVSNEKCLEIRRVSHENIEFKICNDKMYRGNEFTCLMTENDFLKMIMDHLEGKYGNSGYKH